MNTLKALILKGSEAFDASLAGVGTIGAGFTDATSAGLTQVSIGIISVQTFLTPSRSAGQAIVLTGHTVGPRDLEAGEASHAAVRIASLAVAAHFIAREADCGVQVVSSSTGGAVEVAVAA